MSQRWRVICSRVAVIATLFSVLFLITPPSAHAVLPNVCEDERTALSGVSEWKGPNTSGSTLIGTPGYGSTAYEWWGSSGSSFTSGVWLHDRYSSAETNSLCGVSGFFGKAASTLPSIVWDNMVRITDTSLMALQTAQSMEWLNIISEKLIVPLTLGGDGPDDKGLIDVYASGLLVIFIAVGGWAVWKFIRRQHKEALTGIGWNLVAALVGLVLLSQPTLLPSTSSTILGYGQKAVTDVANVLTNTMANNNENISLCALDDSITYTNTFDVMDADGLTNTVNVPTVATRELVCQLWVRSVYEPWSLGQFGTEAPVIAETYTNMDGTQDANRWDEANNSTIQAIIPGLKEQPPAGSLQALHLSATSFTVAEQRWLDMVRKGASPDGAYSKAYSDADRGGKQALIGGNGIEGNVNENSGPAFDYPGPVVMSAATGIDSEVLSSGLNSLGHQQRWDLTRQLVTETSQPGVISVWGGTTDTAAAMRAEAATSGIVNSVLLVVPTLIFSIALLWYQLALGLMFAFLGLMLLAAVFPRFGLQVVKDYSNKVLKYLLMTTVTLFFSSLIGLAVFALPNVLGQTGTAALIVGALGMVALLVMWWKASKGFKKLTLVRGANENSKMDLASAATRATIDATKTTAMAGAAVGMVAATGGASAALQAGGALAVTGATNGSQAVQNRSGAMMSESVDAYRAPKETEDKTPKTAQSQQQGTPQETTTPTAPVPTATTPAPTAPVQGSAPVPTAYAKPDVETESTSPASEQVTQPPVAPVTPTTPTAPNTPPVAPPVAPVAVVPTPSRTRATQKETQPANKPQKAATATITTDTPRRKQEKTLREVAHEPEQLTLTDIKPEHGPSVVTPTPPTHEVAPPAKKRSHKAPKDT